MTAPPAERIALVQRSSLESLGIKGARAPGGLTVAGVARFGNAGSGDLCFCDREPGPEIGLIAPGAFVLCPESLRDDLRQRFGEAHWIVAPDPRALFIDLCRRLIEDRKLDVSDAIPRPFGVHPAAAIGAQAVIHPETRIDQGAVIGAHCVVHRGTWIRSNVVIRDATVVGTEGINAYCGLDGHRRGFPHLAGTIVGEGAEIGAGAVIVRGILNSTRIGAGTIIGNLCNIGHATDIGENVWMSVGCLLGGHSTIGAGASIGMGAAIRDNLHIGAGAQIGMGSIVVRSVGANASVFGNPAKLTPAIKAGPTG